MIFQTVQTTVSRPRMAAAAFAIAAMASTALATPAAAQTRDNTVEPTFVRVNPAEANVSRKINLGIGKSVVVELPRDAKEVFVANPKVANAVVRSTRRVFLIGIGDGSTSVFVMDAEGRQIATLEIAIGRDLNILRRTLATALPNAKVDVVPVGDSVVLTGEVASAADAQQVVDIAKGFVGVSSVGGAAVAGNVINSLTIRGKDQVMLKVGIAEVQRTVLKQLGLNAVGTNWKIAKSPLDFTLDFPLTVQRQVLSNTLFNSTFSNGADSTSAQLRAFERAGIGRVLAEPTLTAISGESAKFVAGGEIPVPSSQDCTTDTLGRRSCTFGIEFKPFGVTLNFTPVVLSEGRISLRVATEVTELDFENQVRFETINVPATKVRKAETTVELPSGASIATAGLIQQASRAQINGLPGLMNLPIIGALFRSRDYQRLETELMIMVTPYISKPVAPSELARPDEGLVDPTDAQGYLLGRLNKIYGVAGSAPAAKAYRGRVGFIHD